MHQYSGSYVADANAHNHRRDRHPFSGRLPGPGLAGAPEGREDRAVGPGGGFPLAPAAGHGRDGVDGAHRLRDAWSRTWPTWEPAARTPAPLWACPSRERTRSGCPSPRSASMPIILGRSGVGKSTVIKHVLAHKLQRKAAGKDNDAIVVIDPHAGPGAGHPEDGASVDSR